MKILAIDFSSSRRSVAAGDGVFTEAANTDPKQARALEMIAEALDGAAIGRRDVECVAIGIGPGSYTGIRASIALAQGWQLATGVKLAGISSADAIAWQARAEGLRGRVAVVIDAQRGELYCATYNAADAGVEPMEPLRIVSIDEVRSCESARVMIAGPEATRWFPAARTIFPRAEWLARLVEKFPNFVRGPELEPIYLRETTFVKAPPPRHVPEI